MIKSRRINDNLTFTAETFGGLHSIDHFAGGKYKNRDEGVLEIHCSQNIAVC